MRPEPAPGTPKLVAAEPRENPKPAPINSIQLSAMLIDQDDRADIGEIAYDQLIYGRKLGSGGFKDCFAGSYLGVSYRPVRRSFEK